MQFLTAYNTELDTLEKELVTFRTKPGRAGYARTFPKMVGG